MGQHTWFLKSRKINTEVNNLFAKADDLEAKIEEGVSDTEASQLFDEIDTLLEEASELWDKNEAEDYWDTFRTHKRKVEGGYIDDELTSREECFEWMENPENEVSFKYRKDDTEEQEKMNKEEAIKKLNEFWDKYPEGVIYFG